MINQENFYILYIESWQKPDEELIKLLEKQATMIHVSSVEDISDLNVYKEKQITLVATDIRGMGEKSETRLKEVREINGFETIPMIVICEKNNLHQFIYASNVSAETVDIPVDKEALVRRCNRVCNVKGFEWKQNED